MKNSFGNSITLTLFGESHGEAIGAVLDGLAPGIAVDMAYISKKLDQRRPMGAISTARREKDEPRLVSGCFEGKTTGTPLCILIENGDVRSSDYSPERLRPSHADYTARLKYHGFADYRGGGHFSGRLTAPIVAAGAILLSALEKKGIYIGTHISRLGGITDRAFWDHRADIAALSEKYIAVLDHEAEARMISLAEATAMEGDSLGGVLETVVVGLPGGVGEPWFDTLEGMLAHALMSLPAAKGIEFGAGFAISDMKGSEANDLLIYGENGKITTKTNNSGGINGGISNGEPIIFRTAIKPTPTISKPQYDIASDSVISAPGRHDPVIVHRARAVADALTALVIADALALRYGCDWLASEDMGSDK